MKSYLSTLCAILLVGNVHAAVSILHTEVSGAQILTSAGGAPTAGGVSVGFFSSPTADSVFTGITSFADLLTAGFKDVRSLAGVSGTPDWDFPLPVSGSVTNISTALLPTGTQLYIVAFNAGTYINGFSGATEWAVIKDDNNIAPADLGSKSTALATVAGAEVLFGTDNGNNVNMASLGAVPEPSRALLGMIGLVALFVRRRR